MGTSANKVRSDFVSEMGGGEDGFVEVELTDGAFKAAVADAKRWFVSKKGYIIFRAVPVTSAVEYVMAADVANVLDVIFQVPSDVAAFFTLGFFDIIPYGPNAMLSVGSGLSNYSGFAQLLEYTENRKKVFSVDPDWSYDQQTRILHISQRSGATMTMMLVQVKLMDFDPVNLSEKDDYLFVRYLKAKLKTAVARVRSKYDSMPAASGPVTMDGKDLLTEAKEEIEKLDLEIFQSQGPDMPIAR